jgi:DNA-binding CsgD family transcriptional regulator
MMTDFLTRQDYRDVLKLGNLCISSLKASRLEIRRILSEICEIFKSNNAEFFPPNETLDGVDLDQACDLNGFNSALKEYADCYWRFDPIYQAKFGPGPTDPVFRNDDVISDSQIKNLENYKKYLVLSNRFSELVIRLRDRDAYYGTFCIIRSSDQLYFSDKDVYKAKLILPYLLNLFQGSYQFSRIKQELKILEYWAESMQKGFLIIDSKFHLVFCNDKAHRLCLKLSESPAGKGCRQIDMVSSLPVQIIEDCRFLFKTCILDHGISTKNRITTTKQGEKYYVRYVLIKENLNESFLACFITGMCELANSKRETEEIIANGCELSSREQTIIRYIATGLTNKELGKLLSISPFTVQNHLRNIFQKTGIVNRTQLANLIK